MVIFFVFLCFGFLSLESSRATDTLLPNQTIKDNGETIVSLGQKFELGFFSPWKSSNRYVGIWFKNISQQTVVWVANRNSPLTDSSGSFSVTATGNIILRNQSSISIWSSNSTAPLNKSVLQLLDTGNLVVKDAESGNYFWQSFDHPCDTIIPGMKFGWNLVNNQSWFLTSWKSLQDPSIGEYNHVLEVQGLPQFVLRKGSDIVYRSGPWDGLRFGVFQIEQNSVVGPFFIFNSTFVYFSFEDNNGRISRYVLNQSGSSQLLTWNGREWVGIYTLQRDQCDEYALCGPYGLCNVNNDPNCRCLPGFNPKILHDWNAFDWKGGCIERIPLNCSKDLGFKKLSGLKLPDNSHLWSNGTDMTQRECEQACLRNCSCLAYAKNDVGCVMWFGNLLDMRQYIEGGHDLYVKMDASELGSESKARRRTVIIIVSVISGVLLLGVISCFLRTGFKRRKGTRRRKNYRFSSSFLKDNFNTKDLDENSSADLPFFDLSTIAAATNNFSPENKLGEGGFGPVYKGVLFNGKEIAIKRLSKYSGQGIEEFKNEITLIAKLQHRNLVRIIGCCIEEEEKMLIYEYLPNKSLDSFIFVETKKSLLDWRKRFEIICGIARGILYLHHDSRLRIIHRDLKASNVLLDAAMNPKISDFGMARIFGGDQIEGNTRRVVGTYGYMSPEYAMEGLFSIKSDVYSFGVLLIEIISGKKISSHYLDHSSGLSLIEQVWNLWKEGRAVEIVDLSLGEQSSSVVDEILRCIQIGLLCVQESAVDRPTMSTIVFALGNDKAVLPPPNKPAFVVKKAHNVDASGGTASVNEVTLTLVQPR